MRVTCRLCDADPDAPVMTMSYVPAGVPPVGGVVELLLPQAGCSRMSPASSPNPIPASQRRRRVPTPRPRPIRLRPPTGSHVAKSGPPRSRLPVVTGRAVVVKLSVVVAGLLPEIVTDVVVNVLVVADGKPVTLIEIALAYVLSAGTGASVAV